MSTLPIPRRPLLLTTDRQEFTSKPLVYIASPQPAKWVKFDVCRWDAPEAIITLFALNQRFKQNADLFTRRLGLGSASAADAVIELKKLNGRKDAMDTIRELLKILSTYVEEGKLNVDSLRGLTNNRVKILPVNIGQHTELCSFFDNNWFIEDEDMPILVECFQGFVRVVDCDYLTKRKPRVLLEKLGCLANLLSERYSVQNEAQGQVSFEPALTKNLRAKAEYLSRLVEEPRRQEAFYKLSALEVRSADEIVIKRYVKIGENKVFGRDEEGTITLKEDGPGLVIYYSRRRTAPALIPFYQIHEQFVEALDIHKRHRTLAMTILMTEDNLLIESELERAGCGRPKTTADGTANASSGKSATRSMVLDLTARTQKRPALNTSSDHTVKIGSSVRFGGSGASKPGPECYNAAGTGAALPTAFSRPSGYSSSPSPLIQLPNGFVGSGSSNRRDSAQPRALGSTRSNGSSAYDGTGSNIDTKKMDLSLMRSQLEEAVALENEKHVSSQSQQTVVVDATSATEAELAIGRAGETFVIALFSCISWTLLTIDRCTSS